MKRVIISALLLAGGLASNAQDYLFENPDNKEYFGVRLGLDITATPGAGTDTYRNGAGFSIGAVYNIPVYKNLYVEPGLSIFYDTFSDNIIVGDNGSLELPQQMSRSFRNFGFRIPIFVGYHFDFTEQISIAPFTGPQFNLSLYAQDAYDKDYGLEAVSLFGEKGFKHLDMQWAVGAALTYNKFVISATAAFGITKIYTVGYDRLRRNTCTIAIGYNF